MDIELEKLLEYDGNEVTKMKMKFSIKNFFKKCGEIPSFLRIWSKLLTKSLIEVLNFCAVWSQIGMEEREVFCCEVVYCFLLYRVCKIYGLVSYFKKRDLANSSSANL